MAERNYNLIELGPRGTGKSFVYCETSPNSILTSGGKTTVAQLFAYLGKRISANFVLTEFSEARLTSFLRFSPRNEVLQSPQHCVRTIDSEYQQ
jgi:predicted ATP-dependent Lon-type protease